jgi:hypothetical protein
MEITDLMIGDWVNLNFDVDYKKGNPIYGHAQVTSINKDGTIDVNCAFDNSESMQDGWDLKLIKPIPLTSEILAKNSFLKVEMIEYPSHRVGISFLYRITPEGLRIFVQNACVGGPTCTMIKTCKYVHEVQHMIKMCDIEKTFVL